jgi:hypothetical protein
LRTVTPTMLLLEPRFDYRCASLNFFGKLIGFNYIS